MNAQSSSVSLWHKLWSEYLRQEFGQLSTNGSALKWNLIDEAELLKEDEKLFSGNPNILRMTVEVYEPKLPVRSREEEEENNLMKGDDPMPQEPEYPSPDECCGSGCRVCVYDLYEQDLERYHKRLEKWKQRQNEKLRRANIDNNSN